MKIKYYHGSKGLNIASGDRHSPSLFCITGIPEDQLTALRDDLNRHFPVAREETWMPDDVEYREIDPKLADSGDIASFDYTPDLTRLSTWVVGSLTVAPVSPRSLVIRPGDYVKGGGVERLRHCDHRHGGRRLREWRVQPQGVPSRQQDR